MEGLAALKVETAARKSSKEMQEELIIEWKHMDVMRR